MKGPCWCVCAVPKGSQSGGAMEDSPARLTGALWDTLVLGSLFLQHSPDRRELEGMDSADHSLICSCAKAAADHPSRCVQEASELCWLVCWVAKPAADAVTNIWELSLAFKLSALRRCSRAFKSSLWADLKTILRWAISLLTQDWNGTTTFPPMALNIRKSLLLQGAVPGITRQVV